MEGGYSITWSQKNTHTKKIPLTDRKFYFYYAMQSYIYMKYLPKILNPIDLIVSTTSSSWSESKPLQWYFLFWVCMKNRT